METRLIIKFILVMIQLILVGIQFYQTWKGKVEYTLMLVPVLMIMIVVLII